APAPRRSPAPAAARPARPSRAGEASVAGLVDQLVLAYPRHHFAQLAADLLDRMLAGHPPPRQQGRRAGPALEDEVLRVFSALDPRQRIAHRLAGFGGDDLRTGDVFAVFSVVRDRIIHRADAAFVHQVDDQLELVQAFEVRHFRRIAG